MSNFDWTINVGNLLTLFGIVLGAIIMVLGLRGKVDLLTAGLGNLQENLAKLEKDVDRIGEIMLRLVRQEERLSASDRRMNNLSARVFLLETGKQLPERDADGLLP